MIKGHLGFSQNIDKNLLISSQPNVTLRYLYFEVYVSQGCIIRSILPSGMGANGVSSEHAENMEMFSSSPTIGAL